MNELEVYKKFDVAVDALTEAREFIAEYSDVIDGDEGHPLPNKAMRLTQVLDDAIKYIAPKRMSGVDTYLRNSI